MSIVRAIKSAVVTVNGVPVNIREGDPYDPEDDVVQQHKWAFRSDVEQATAGPGERRGRRP
jgi:hypothetical protein